MTRPSAFELDLSDLEIEDVEVLMQDGGRGMPEFAASSCDNCSCGTCSCTVEPTPIVDTNG
jgi:hypothetical protein